MILEWAIGKTCLAAVHTALLSSTLDAAVSLSLTCSQLGLQCYTCLSCLVHCCYITGLLAVNISVACHLRVVFRDWQRYGRLHQTHLACVRREPAKFVAKLRESKTDNNMLLFKCDIGAGHFSQSGRFDKLYDMALQWAFLLKCQHMVHKNG